HRPYLDAFTRGMIAGPVIDSAVARVLRVKFDLGLFERPYVDPDSAAFWNGHANHRTLAVEAARASVVLLRNGPNALPRDRRLRSVAVIGVDARGARLGGYSGPGNAKISILGGVIAKLGAGRRVTYAPGPGRVSREYVVVPTAQLSTVADGRAVKGLSGEY